MVSTQEVPMLPPVIPHALSPKTVFIGPLGTRTGGFAKRTVRGATHGMLRSILSYNVTRAVIGGVLFCYFVVCSIVGVSFSLAGEVIPIRTILRNPESYYLHVVTLEGTVRHVKTPSIPFGSCGQGRGALYPPFTFTLEDETGSIVVGRMRVCRFLGLKVPEVSEGEKVIIDAEIFGPDQDSEFRKDFPGELPTTYAVVMNVRRP